MYALIAGTAVSAGSADKNTVTTSAVDTTGADFIVLVRSDFGASRAAVSDSKGNSWNALTATSNASTGTCTIFWSRPTSVGSGHTFTATQANSFPTLSVLAFSGGINSPVDQQNGATASAATSVQTGSVTPSDSNQLIIAGFTSDNASVSIALNSGFTVPVSTSVSTNHECGAIGYLIQNSAAAVNPQWTWNTASNVAVRIATFKTATVATVARGAIIVCSRGCQ